MSAMIVPSEIPGGSVYGVKQVQYIVDGISGKNYIDALTAASFKESVAIEETARAYTTVVRERQKKIDDLGSMLACISRAVADLPAKKQSSSDTATVTNGAWVKSTALMYGITLNFESNSDKMKRENLMKAQTTVQYEMDKEDNNLQQDMVSLQSFISKRDNAYSTAAKLVKKANDAAANTISNIGA